MNNKIQSLGILLAFMLVVLFVSLCPTGLWAKEAVVRVAILPPVSKPFEKFNSYRIKQFPRELTDLSDNAVYEALLKLQQKYGGKIKVIENFDPDLVPAYGSQELEIVYSKIYNRDHAYFNKKYRENGKVNGKPRVNLLLAWQLYCSPEELEPDNPMPFILYCYLFSRKLDPDSETGVIFKRRKYLKLDAGDVGQNDQIIQDTLLYMIEQFIQSEELDINHEWGGR